MEALFGLFGFASMNLFWLISVIISIIRHMLVL